MAKFYVRQLYDSKLSHEFARDQANQGRASPVPSFVSVAVYLLLAHLAQDVLSVRQ